MILINDWLRWNGIHLSKLIWVSCNEGGEWAKLLKIDWVYLKIDQDILKKIKWVNPKIESHSENDLVFLVWNKLCWSKKI